MSRPIRDLANEAALALLLKAQRQMRRRARPALPSSTIGLECLSEVFLVMASRSRRLFWEEIEVRERYREKEGSDDETEMRGEDSWLAFMLSAAIILRLFAV